MRQPFTDVPNQSAGGASRAGRKARGLIPWSGFQTARHKESVSASPCESGWSRAIKQTLPHAWPTG